MSLADVAADSLCTLLKIPQYLTYCFTFSSHKNFYFPTLFCFICKNDLPSTGPLLRCWVCIPLDKHPSASIHRRMQDLPRKKCQYAFLTFGNLVLCFDIFCCWSQCPCWWWLHFLRHHCAICFGLAKHCALLFVECNDSFNNYFVWFQNS